MGLEALDQVGLGLVLQAQDWAVSELDQEPLDQVVLAAMDLVEQGQFLVFTQLEENHQSQV